MTSPSETDPPPPGRVLFWLGLSWALAFAVVLGMARALGSPVEAGLALAIGIFIAWWLMRGKNESPRKSGNDDAKGGDGL